MSNPDRLLSACQKGNLPLIRQLIEDEGISPNHANGIQQSALHIASWWSRSDCVQYLLAKGASHQGKNTVTGATPLHCVLQSAAKSSPDETVRRHNKEASLLALLQAGADPEAQDFGKRTPLDYLDKDDPDRDEILSLFQQFIQPIPEIFQALAAYNWKEMRNILLIDYPNALFQSLDGLTPFLRLVMEWCDLDTEHMDDEKVYTFYKTAIHGMLELGNSSELDDDRKDGVAMEGEWMSVLIAREKGSDEKVTAMDILCQAIMDRYKLIHEDGEDDHQLDDWCVVVDQLVVRSPKPAYTEATKSLWLEVARRNWCHMATKLYSNWKVSYDITNRQGMTPMQFAARSGSVEMVQLLWEMDPVLAQRQFRHQDHRNTTPLQAAEVNGHESVVRLLHALSS